jgi:sugar lactone lactonase YvrE
LPDLPAVGAVGPDEPSTPTAFDLPPIPNDLVFDGDGNLYVTDSLQATIFRYPPGGGLPQIWFQSALFDGIGPFPFGANGLRLSPDRSRVYVAVSTSAALLGGGAIVSVPLVESPIEADLEFFHFYAPGELPDQLAFAQDGKLFASLAVTNQISVLSGSGVELTRISSQAGDDIPLDAPAAIAFDSRSKSLLVANHALLSGDAAHFAVLQVYIGDPGDPLETP